MQIDVILSELYASVNCVHFHAGCTNPPLDLILILQGYYISGNLHANDSAS